MIELNIRPTEIYGIYWRGDFVKYKELTNLLDKGLKADPSKLMEGCRISVFTVNSQFSRICRKIAHILKWSFSSTYRAHFIATISIISGLFMKQHTAIKLKQVEVHITSADNNLKGLNDKYTEELSKIIKDPAIDQLSKKLEKLTSAKMSYEAIVSKIKKELITLQEETSKLLEKEDLLIKELNQDSLDKSYILTRKQSEVISENQQLLNTKQTDVQKLSLQIEFTEKVILFKVSQEIKKIEEDLSEARARFQKAMETASLIKLKEKITTLDKNRNRQVHIHNQLLKLCGLHEPKYKAVQTSVTSLVETPKSQSPVIQEKKYKIQMLLYMSLGTNLQNMKSIDAVEKLIGNEDLYAEINCSPTEGTLKNFLCFLEALEELFPTKSKKIALYYMLQVKRPVETSWRSQLYQDLAKQIDQDYKKRADDLLNGKDKESITLVINHILDEAIKSGLDLGLKNYHISSGIIVELSRAIKDTSFKIRDPQTFAIQFLQAYLEQCKSRTNLPFGYEHIAWLSACTFQKDNNETIRHIAHLLIKTLAISYETLNAKALLYTDFANNSDNPYIQVESFQKVIFELLNKQGYSHPILPNEVISAEILETILEEQSSDLAGIAQTHNLATKETNYKKWHAELLKFYKRKPDLIEISRTELNKLIRADILKRTDENERRSLTLLLEGIKATTVEEFVEQYELLLISTGRMHKDLAEQLVLNKADHFSKKLKKLRKKTDSESVMKCTEMSTAMIKLLKLFTDIRLLQPQHLIWANSSDEKWNNIWITWYFSAIKLTMTKMVDDFDAIKNSQDFETMISDFAYYITTKRKEFCEFQLLGIQKMAESRARNQHVENALRKKVFDSEECVENSQDSNLDSFGLSSQQTHANLEQYQRLLHFIQRIKGAKPQISDKLKITERNSLLLEQIHMKQWFIKLCWNDVEELRKIRAGLMKEKSAAEDVHLDKLAMLDCILEGPTGGRLFKSEVCAWLNPYLGE